MGIKIWPPFPDPVPTNGPDVVYLGPGNDVFDALGGNDYVNGGAGHDNLYGSGGNDTLDGWTGDDKLYGGNGNDTLLGYDGYDQLYGGAGNDTLKGENGFDDLYGGAGVDKLYGGTGDDYFYFEKTDSGDIFDGKSDTIYDFNQSEGDEIWLKGSYTYAGDTNAPADGQYSVWQKDGDYVVTWNAAGDVGYHDVIVKGDNPEGDVSFY
jgi:Ca2+-binding RTX toxin-like protein